jgi:broad specificity phosphatase PhoE
MARARIGAMPRGAVTIVLARHGRPALDDAARRRITGREIGHWYRRYNGFGIEDGVEPPAPVREAAKGAGCVVASDLRRAIESVARLGATPPLRVEPALREVGFPESLDSSVRLTPDAWVLIARGVQLLDRCDCDERISEVRTRAAHVAGTLARLAGEHGSVLAVGHGWFNQFIARELRRQGWRGPRVVPSGYWSTASFAGQPSERPVVPDENRTVACG